MRPPNPECRIDLNDPVESRVTAMIRRGQPVASVYRVSRSERAVSNLKWPRSHNVHRVSVEDALRVPLLTRALRKRIRTLLHGGERAIVLDLARVSRIDAAGVGELVRAYNMTTTANGVLRVVHATRWVREILQRVGLFDLLSGSSPPVARRAR